MLRHPPLLVLAAAMALFHFANAPILLLLGMELEQRTRRRSPCSCRWRSSPRSWSRSRWRCSSAPAPTAGGASRCCSWASPPCRCGRLLYALTEHPAWLVAGQLLDGISLGTLDALLALILADIMRGTGRYNAARGVVGTIQGIGGSASNVAAGLLVVGAGYAVRSSLLARWRGRGSALVLLALRGTGPAPGKTVTSEYGPTDSGPDIGLDASLHGTAGIPGPSAAPDAAPQGPPDATVSFDPVRRRPRT